MLVNKITEVTIYESPDGGRTVYARKAGESVRELYMRDPKLDEELAEIERKQRWQDIFEHRNTITGLKDLCEQIEILYELGKK